MFDEDQSKVDQESDFHSCSAQTQVGMKDRRPEAVGCSRGGYCTLGTQVGRIST